MSFARGKRLRAAVVVGLLLWAQRAHAQATFVQAANATPGAIFVTDGIEAVAFAAPVATSGAVIVKFDIAADVTVTSVVDDLASCGGYTLVQTHNDAPVESFMYWCSDASGAQTITVTLSAGAAQNAAMQMWEVGCSNTMTAAQFSANHGDAATTHDSGTVTPDTTHAILLGGSYSQDARTWTTDADFTENHNHSRGVAGYRVSTTAQAITSTTTVSTNSNTLLVSIGCAAAGGATPRRAVTTQ